MPQTWYYRHKGKKHGPVSTARLRQLAAAGQLGPKDMVWAEGREGEVEIEAASLIDFPARAPAAKPLPEWLDPANEHFDMIPTAPTAPPPTPPPAPPTAVPVPPPVRVAQVPPGYVAPVAVAVPVPSAPTSSAPPPVAPPRAAPPPAAPPPAAPPRAAPPPPAPPPPSPEETGFNPDTGEILDAEKFRRWQQQQRRRG